MTELLISAPQRVLLDKVFLDLFSKISAHLDAEARRWPRLIMPTGSIEAASHLHDYVISVEYHEDKYKWNRGGIAAAKEVQPDIGKTCVFEAIEEFCTKTGLTDREGYKIFMEYYQEIPFINGDYGERDVLSKIQALRGLARGAGQ